MSSYKLSVDGSLQEPLVHVANVRNEKQGDPLKSTVTAAWCPPPSIASSSGMAFNHITCTVTTTAGEVIEPEIEFETVCQYTLHSQQTERREGSSMVDGVNGTNTTSVVVEPQLTTRSSYTSELPLPYDPCKFRVPGGGG